VAASYSDVNGAYSGAGSVRRVPCMEGLVMGTQAMKTEGELIREAWEDAAPRQNGPDDFSEESITVNKVCVVVFRDANLWVAQCLEYDIGAQAPDLDTLKARLAVTLAFEKETSVELHSTPFAGIDPAPDSFREFAIWAVWDVEAAVWVSNSDDVPGLIIEAPNIEKLADFARALAPELSD
jgi:hypothetical protein